MGEEQREKKICAIIDAQGFFTNHIFYPREMAIFNDDHQICVEIQQDLKNIEREKDRITINYQQYNIHGLPTDGILKPQTKKVIQAGKLKAFIEFAYFRVRSEEKYLFGVKNQQLKKLLMDFQIPFFDLERENVGGEYCPPLKVLDLFYKSRFCTIHASTKSPQTVCKLHCASRKAENIWAWLSTKLKSDAFMEDFEEFEQFLASAPNQ